MALINCEECNKEFKITPSRLKKNKHHTCSKSCLGKLSSRLHSKKVKTTCTVCNKEILYKQSHFKQVANHTCSKECMGKLRKDLYKGKDNPKALKLTDFEKIFWKRVSDISYRARAKKLDFDLDYQFLIDLYNNQEGLCYYSGYPLKIQGGKSFNTMSVDKIDPTKGYTKDNVVLCLNCINMMKSDHSLKDLEEVFRALIFKKDKYMKVRYKLLFPDSQRPTKAHESDAGYDLYVHRVEDKGEYIRIYTGIGVQADVGHYFLLAPRSSIFKKGLTMYNSLGIIDNGYNQELIGNFLKTSSFKELPKKGDRLMQLLPQEQFFIDWQVVENFEERDRKGGFGSSGN